MKFIKEEGGRIYFSMTKTEARNLSDVLVAFKADLIAKDTNTPSSYRAILTFLIKLGGKK